MKPSLLLAEGDAELRDVYSRFLRKHGYDVAVAGNGLQCLQHLRQNDPDLLVLDLELIWGGGDGVLGWLREDAAHAGLPVVLIATAGRMPSAAEARQPPVVEFLAKPFALAALENSVWTALAERGRAQRSAWPGAARRSAAYYG